MDKISIATFIGALISVIGGVYWKLKSLEKENYNLKNKDLENELKDISDNSISADLRSSLDQSVKYWKVRRKP